MDFCSREKAIELINALGAQGVKSPAAAIKAEIIFQP